ncbi:DUF1800 domain-containing protein [Actinocrispum sp. NPDC049592]|uniref:DUF1800 domain-containing protein n=1 Tax=Actinocrispum sp. NPDC049592 TaxID=3154835 RepID=UPI0034155CE7
MGFVGERAAVRRLHERFGLGPRPGELNSRFDQVSAALLGNVTPSGPPPPQLQPEPKAAKDPEQQTAITVWWLDRMAATDSPLVERMTWFWHGHFATSAQKVRGAGLMLAQNETLRRLGLGDFTSLAQAMIVDPAMLIWLDGQKNTAKAANENLGREYMELFTLGVGQYSEQDVREAARALTGWKVDRQTMTASVVARQHDPGSKTVLGTTGPLDAHSLVDLLVSRPASPRFIAQRMWTRFVGRTPPAEDVLVRLVTAYGPNRDLHALVRAIAAEPVFRDEASTVVKQPVDWVVGVMRAFKIRPSELSTADQKKLLAGLRGMGQVPFLPPSVGGWPSGPAWLTTAAGMSRLQVARLLTAKVDGFSVSSLADLLGVDWSDRTRAALSPLERQPRQLAAVAVCAPEYVVSG